MTCLDPSALAGGRTPERSFPTTRFRAWPRIPRISLSVSGPNNLERGTGFEPCLRQAGRDHLPSSDDARPQIVPPLTAFQKPLTFPGLIPRTALLDIKEPKRPARTSRSVVSRVVFFHAPLDIVRDSDVQPFVLLTLQCVNKHSLNRLERGTGFEPATTGLEGRDSTAELPPQLCRTPFVRLPKT